MVRKVKFIDLFAGIGGFRIAFDNENYQCVFSSEINEHCREVYQNNFGDIPYGDITKINLEEIPDFDILTGGFPCQPFSICGKQKGFNDVRGGLFFNICDIIKLKSPKVVVLENVKHLIHHNNGNTFKTMIETLEDLGYFVKYKVLNSKDFGVPQNRERIIIIASKYKAFDFNKLKFVSNEIKLRDFLDKNLSIDCQYLNKSEYTLIDNIRLQESGLLFVGYRNKGIWKKGIRPNTEHLSRVHRQPNRIYSIDGVHPTLPSQETSGRFFIYIPETDKVRKLSIDECYRIMGFPENFQKSTIIGEAYKQIGNSVCVPLVQEIARQIKLQNLLEESNESPHKTVRFIQKGLFAQVC
ncbi:MAG: DNA (cytosine-5-)-methyltransferase [Candidatus Gastranaerophilales bacterium]|nr:DNA (cytosine-5-)-methyltransferase [Candidatus Gastranaerophilales bacterium]